jgi:hypothetical protein
MTKQSIKLKEFKIGDKVVCIDDNIDDYAIFVCGEEIKLKKFKTYTVNELYDDKYSTVVLENNTTYAYSSYRFVLLKEYRKQKLKEICSKPEIK